MPRSLSWSEVLWWALCAGILAWKLLLPGFIGMADNGDFAKVAGPVCLASADRTAENFFHPLYLRANQNCYTPHVPMAEIVLARVASGVEQTVSDRTRFDIRWLGAVHCLLFLAFYFAVLRLLRPLGGIARFSLSLLALWIFADIGTLAYFNSFYSDTAAILGGLLAAILAAHLLADEKSTPWTMVWFGLAALLYVTSKAQHGLFGLLPAGLALLLGWREKSAISLAVGMGLLAGTVRIETSSPGWYTAQAQFDVVFFRILKESPTPAQDLAELGLSSGDARFIGLTAYVHGGPMENRQWVENFRERCTYRNIARLYLRHPSRAWAILRGDLEQQAWQRRAPGLANFAKSSGRPEGAMDTSLGTWSALRTWSERKWPAQIVVWLVLLPAAGLWFGVRGASRRQRGIVWTIVGVSLVAMGEFAVACLADATETPRHLIMFHIFTDAAIFLELALAAGVLEAACPARLRKPAFALTAAGVAIFAVFVVRAEVFPAAIPVSLLWDRAGAVDDTSPAVVYSGNWQSGPFTSAYNGTLTYSDEPGAVARYSFDGTGLRYVYTKAPNRGMAVVTIDGTVYRTIDLYAPQIEWQASTVIDGLSPDPHRVEIQVAGRRHPASSGDFIDIDALVGR